MKRSQEWREKSYDYLKAEIAQIIAQIQIYCHKVYGQSLHPDDLLSNPSEEIKSQTHDETPPPLALEWLCKCFGLSARERTLLIICAGWEFEAALVDQYSLFIDEPISTSPSLRLLQKLIPDLDNSLLSPHSALQKFQLIEASSNDTLLPDSPLKIDCSVLQYLLGNGYYDPYEPPSVPARKRFFNRKPSFKWLAHIPASYYKNAEQLHALLTDKHTLNPTVQLCSPDPDANHQIATLACNNLGQDLYRVSLDRLFFSSPADLPAFHNWLIWWHRRALLQNDVLFIHCGNLPELYAHQKFLLTEIIQTLTTPVILSSSEPLPELSIPALAIQPISTEEQQAAWHALLSNVEAEVEIANLAKFASPLASQFNFNLTTIHPLCRRIVMRIKEESLSKLEDINEQLWQDCRAELHADLGRLAQHVEPKATWDQLALDKFSSENLHTLIGAARDRHKVYCDWRMGRSSERGIGMTALLYGLPGTGKTAATEVIAHELGVDFYRLNLFWLSGEHIDEAKRQLEKIFDEVEQTGALLVLDEVESLIGQRADAKDFRDPYVNHQFADYLLQRMEVHTGLTILTTNQPSTIDPIFTGQIDFKVWFKFPPLEQRFEIWKRMFPKTAPTQGLSFQRLAQLKASGGLIRNIALEGAFLAAGERRQAQQPIPIQMRHLLEAAHRECLREDKLIADEEICGWV
jgi:ATPase family associated with various cellular activities (AAA)